MTKREHVNRQKRLESLNLVSFSHLDTNGRTDMEVVGRTVDLSEGGILLEIPNPLPSTNAEVELTLGIQDEVIRVKGKIVHQRELDNDHFGLGISFVDLSDEDASIISRFLNE